MAHIVIAVGCGSTLDSTVDAAIATAQVMHKPVQFGFNGRTITVNAATDAFELCQRFTASKVGDRLS